MARRCPSEVGKYCDRIYLCMCIYIYTEREREREREEGVYMVTGHGEQVENRHGTRLSIGEGSVLSCFSPSQIVSVFFI